MIKKLLEEFKANEVYMETVKQLLEEDWLINRYGHRESVRRYKESLENTRADASRRDTRYLNWWRNWKILYLGGYST